MTHRENGRTSSKGERVSARRPSRDPVKEKSEETVLRLRDFEAEERRRLRPAVFDYIAGGSDDEVTLRENEAAFARLGLVPRVLRSTGPPQLEIGLLGSRVSMPILIAPTAFHRLLHPDGECATARAAATAGTILIGSMASTVAIEDVVNAARSTAANGTGADVWFQLNLQPDLMFTEALVRRAEAAGCKALVVTVDSPVFGNRERDRRHGFVELPDGMCCENMREPGDADLGSASLQSAPEKCGRDIHTPTTRVRKIVFSPEFSWEHIDWLRGITRLPIVLKGIVHPDDARLARERGVDAIIVSNHGGRQLDTVPATIELLPAIAAAVDRRIPIVIDGGIRRGTDVVKALAFGANAVAIGRPVLWGLAAGGAAGVSQVLEILRAELARALTLCGCRSPGDVSSGLVRRHRMEDGS